MEIERTLDAGKIKNEGLVIGVIGHFTLVLRSDSSFYILDDNGSHLDCLSQTDLQGLEQIVGLFNDWSSCHRLKTK